MTLPHLVVVEPHMDDAALSVGGRLLRLRGQRRVTILSVVRRSNFVDFAGPRRDLFDAATVTAMRTREAAQAADLLGAEHRCMDEVDSMLRYRPEPAWSATTYPVLAQGWAAWSTFGPDVAEISALAGRMGEVLGALQPDELWLPMGIGEHIDHVLTRSACLELLASRPDALSRTKVGFYEDVPYAADHPVHAEVLQAALAGRGTRLRRATTDVADVFEEKLRVLAVFRSQAPARGWDERVRAVALAAGGGRLAEAHHELEGPVAGRPTAIDASPHRDALRALDRQIRAWRSAAVRQAIAVVALGPFGRFDRLVEALLAAFGEAYVRAYHPRAFAFEVAGFVHPRVGVRQLASGALGMAQLVLTENARVGTPTLLLLSRGRVPLAGTSLLAKAAVAVALPLRPTLSCRAAGDVVIALAQHERRGGGGSGAGLA